MIGRFIRVICGFVLACLAAGLTLVLFVYTPFDIADLHSERAVEIGLMTLAAATHGAVFSAPFALIGAVFGEWQRIGSFFYYVLVAVVIAGLGFLAQFWPEASSQAAIVNGYAVTAFLLTGLVSGLVYWLFSGRFARGSYPIEPTDITPPPRHPAASSGLPAQAQT
jgi:hypothetical protein